MRKLLILNSVVLVALVAINEVVRSSSFNDMLFQLNYRTAQTFSQSFPFGNLPWILGLLSLCVPLCLAFLSNKIKTDRAPLLGLMLLNPVLVYSICNIGYSQFGLTLSSCPL